MGFAQTEDSNPGVAPAFAVLRPLFPIVAISALNESFALEMRETQSQEKESTKCIIVWYVISGLSNRLLDAAVLIFFASFGCDRGSGQESPIALGSVDMASLPLGFASRCCKAAAT
jgi:hypothetical protein